MTHVYLSDTSTIDYGATLPANTLASARGTIAGADPPADFASRVDDWLGGQGEGAPTTHRYAAEAYDATVLAALAADQGGDDDPSTIAANLSSVTGADGGTACTSYAACLALVRQREPIAYSGLSGIGPINDRHEPSSGPIGVYRYGADNASVLSETLTGHE